jgi:hypothetical protein
MTAVKTATDPVIEALATALAEAEVTSEKTTTAHREAEAARDAVRTRIQDMDARRGEIAARRAAGDQRPEDGAELAVISVDRELLDGILAQREADVVVARAVAEKEKRALDQALHNLAREEAVRTAAALDLRLEELAGLLLQGILQANAIAQRLGRGMPNWRAPAALMGALTPLDSRWQR